MSYKQRQDRYAKSGLLNKIKMKKKCTSYLGVTTKWAEYLCNENQPPGPLCASEMAHFVLRKWPTLCNFGSYRSYCHS